MPHIRVLRQLANEHIAQFNHLAAKGMAASIELQTECALETLSEVACRCNYSALYVAISERKNQLEHHRILSPITVMGVDA